MVGISSLIDPAQGAYLFRSATAGFGDIPDCVRVTFNKLTAYPILDSRSLSVDFLRLCCFATIGLKPEAN